MNLHLVGEGLCALPTLSSKPAVLPPPSGEGVLRTAQEVGPYKGKFTSGGCLFEFQINILGGLADVSAFFFGAGL